MNKDFKSATRCAATRASALRRGSGNPRAQRRDRVRGFDVLSEEQRQQLLVATTRYRDYYLYKALRDWLSAERQGVSKPSEPLITLNDDFGVASG